MLAHSKLNEQGCKTTDCPSNLLTWTSLGACHNKQAKKQRADTQTFHRSSQHSKPGSLVVIPCVDDPNDKSAVHPDSKRFYELLYLDRTPSCPFTLNDYTRWG